MLSHTAAAQLGSPDLKKLGDAVEGPMLHCTWQARPPDFTD